MGEIESNLTPYIRFDGQEPEFEVIGDDVWLLEDEYNPANLQQKLKNLINR
jgi:hypothetical protein